MTVSYEQELARTGRIAFTINGVSMRPLFHAQEDMLLLEACDPATLKNLDIVLFKRYTRGEQYVLHRIVDRDAQGNFIIAGDNCIDVGIVPRGISSASSCLPSAGTSPSVSMGLAIVYMKSSGASPTAFVPACCGSAPDYMPSPEGSSKGGIDQWNLP